MFHGLAFYTKLDSQQLLDFRRKYDPTVDLMEDHISIIFPIPDEISERQISTHIDGILTPWKPFKVHINGYVKSWDHWLFLTLGEGNEKVNRLFKEMFTGILKPYLRSDLPFLPHISAGYFGKGQFNIFNPKDELDEDKYRLAQTEIEEINIDVWRQIDVFTLVSLNDELTELRNIKEFII